MTPLPPDRWSEIEALFGAAAEADAPDRAALLGEALPEVAAEVGRLLRAEPEAADFFDRPSGFATLLDGTLPPAPEDDLAPGARVGPWEVEAEAGRGGMGTVYRAHRADGAFEQTVALKVVRRGMDSAGVVRRFVRERALLAGLRHPGIAALLDGGTAPDGRPYLALEFVDGEPITTFADAHQLSVRDRVRLVIDVCAAVAHAHRRLVVHRDLKPSNVLVAEIDGVPVVKLLDFGVAALLDTDAARTRTIDGPRPLTPAYAAPEQFNGQAVTTAADVYALGALLFELLSGQRAGPAGHLSSTTLPPSRVATGTASAALIAASRGTTPDGLRRALRGDLDAVCLKALRPEPDARYASADALATDLGRWLDGLPVAARRGSRRYVAGRFVRRHRWGVGVATAFAVVLIGGVVALAASQRETARQRDRAEAALSRAEAFGRFAADLFRVEDGARPITDRADEVTLREALAEGHARLDTTRLDPTVRADLLSTIGTAYRSLGLHGEAIPPLSRAVALNERYRTARDPKARETHRQLGDPAVSDSARGRAADELAELYLVLGQLGDAERLFRESLAFRRRAFPPTHAEVAEGVNDLGVTLWQADRYAEAEPLLREALALRRLSGTPTVNSLINLGNFLLPSRPDEASALFSDALESTAATHGRSHDTYAFVESGHARALLQQGRVREAEAELRHALGIMRRSLAPGHWRIALAEAALGDALCRSDRAASGARLLRGAADVFTDSSLQSRRRRALADLALGDCLLRLSRRDEAAERIDAARPLLTAIGGPGGAYRRWADEAASRLSAR